MAALSKMSTTIAAVLTRGPPSWATIFKLVVLLLAIANLKSVPLTWHYRFYRNLYVHLWHRRKVLPTPSHLFSPITTTSRSPFYECDLNMHKSNSTYFSDLDIARTHLVCHLIKRSLAQRTARGERQLYVALAGVSCLFRREIKPFEKYEISTRVLGWDGKWVWVVSHFMSLKRPREGQPRKIFASALSKYVFKSGRVTVRPETVFMESGLLPRRPKGIGSLSVESAPPSAPESVNATPPSELVDMSASSLATATGSDDESTSTSSRGSRRSRGSIGSEDPLMMDLHRSWRMAQQHKKLGDEYWTWSRIEEERRRGVDIAGYMLGLDKLEGEMRTGDEEGLVRIGRFW